MVGLFVLFFLSNVATWAVMSVSTDRKVDAAVALARIEERAAADKVIARVAPRNVEAVQAAAEAATDAAEAATQAARAVTKEVNR